MQSNSTRIAVAVGAVVAIVALFVVFSGGGEENDDDPAEVTESAMPVEPGGGTGAGAGAPGPEPKPEKPAFATLRVTGDGDEVRELSFEKGEEIRIAFDSEVDEEVHIHGYDRYVDIVAGETERISFPAEIDGVFEIELHGTGAQIAQLTVEP